jgi:PAS domain S-box-containing protein
MTGSYDLALVALSVGIAVFASYVSLALAGRVASEAGRLRAAWLAGGSLAMGGGIWSMHFVGMLAYRLPVPIAYDVRLWLLSLVVAVAASAVALLVVSRPRQGWVPLVAGGLCMGPAIAGMHYIGMAAMRVPATVRYHTGLVALSVAIAIGAAIVALTLAFRFRTDAPRAEQGPRWLAAAAMGGGIAAMHYVGMAAARFELTGNAVRLGEGGLVASSGLAGAVVAVSSGVLMVALVGTLVDRRLRVRSAETEALRRSEDRFRSLVLATSQIIWTADAHGEFGADEPDWGAFTGTPPERYRGWGWLDSVHPGDRVRAAAAWRAALAEQRMCEVEARVRRWDGEYRHMELRAVPVREPGGRVREWVGAVVDVTEQVREEEARDFLAEAARVLAGSIRYEETLANVARLAVPHLADWCAVDVVGERGTVQRIHVAHPDPRRVGMVRELEERYPADPASPFGLHNVLRTGQSEMVPQISDEMLAASARDEEHLRLIQALGLRSYVIVPLSARGQVVGAITLVSAESGRRYGQADLWLAEELARRAGVAIDNARLFAETEEARAQLEQQAAELQEAQAAMEMAHRELQRANEELVKRTQEAERARAEAEAANQAKSAFLATMSHELRTPLNAIGGYAQLMEMGIHGPVSEQQRENLEKIRRSQTHLLGLINDVLNFAKIEAGHVRYELADVPVNAVLTGVEAMVEPQLRSRSLQYTFRPGDPTVAVRADRERLEQIVLNLLTNAVKFTEPGGSVVLEWEPCGAVVCIRVRDTGRGIPPERQESIFEPFVQVDPTLTRSSEGTGLGLSISRDLARAMNGDLTVQSQEGAGSTFTLTLPIARVASSGDTASSPQGDSTR